MNTAIPQHLQKTPTKRLDLSVNLVDARRFEGLHGAAPVDSESL